MPNGNGGGDSGTFKQIIRDHLIKIIVGGIASSILFVVGAIFQDPITNWAKNFPYPKARIQEIKNIPECKITQKVESNAVFVIIPRQYLDKILKKYFFYIWNENGPVVRLMTSFDIREEDIDNFIDTVKKAIKN